MQKIIMIICLLIVLVGMVGMFTGNTINTLVASLICFSIGAVIFLFTAKKYI